MSGYSATNRGIMVPDGGGISPIDQYAVDRNVRYSRRETYLLQPNGGTIPGFPNPDRVGFTTGGLPVAVESWFAYPVVAGGTGVVSVYHDSDDDSGLASLQLDVTNSYPVEIPGAGSGANNPRWFCVNNATVPVVVVLFWRSWS